jgi:hypothetical protein
MEVVLQILIAFKNKLPSAGFEPANLGPNGKHDKHKTTKNEKLRVNAYVCVCSLQQINTHVFKNPLMSMP